MLKIVASISDNSKGIIYDRNIFIIQTMELTFAVVKYP
jgi:hypothetical protein